MISLKNNQDGTQSIEFPTMTVICKDGMAVDIFPSCGWYLELAIFVENKTISFGSAKVIISEWKKWAWDALKKQEQHLNNLRAISQLHISLSQSGQ